MPTKAKDGGGLDDCERCRGIVMEMTKQNNDDYDDILHQIMWSR
jgi:hypothetical protein